jgi:hypothetical protein
VTDLLAGAATPTGISSTRIERARIFLFWELNGTPLVRYIS